ncbi:MAG: hypothetical protein RDU25_03615 [Patescibacteria group bacterium]|nr:hypothetical protein [Patescibacteria group bacterium]
MTRSGKVIVYLGIFALGITLFSVIPRLFLDVYMSPDETAVAVSAKTLAGQGTMKIKDRLLDLCPWVHPRSFVSQGGYMVPVGFLGLPLIMAFVFLLLGQFGMLWFTPLLALSATIPLWCATKKLGQAAQVSAILAWLTFPTVILYANRGLFPNLVAVSLMVWATFLIWFASDEERQIAEWLRVVCIGLSGVAVGTACAIRPVEAVWILVWLCAVLIIRQRAIKKIDKKLLKSCVFILAVSVLPMISAWMAYKTYGSFWSIGYNLRDTVLAPQPSNAAEVSQNLLPFGLHPRAVLANFRAYLLGMYWPWLVATVLTLFVGRRDRTTQILGGAGIATASILTLLYGQALYQDHVGVNIASIGNSFLRYFLPLTPLFALSVAATISAIQKKLGRISGLLVIIPSLVGLSIYGTYLGLYQDGEGVVISSRELLRYADIRSSAQAVGGDYVAVLSERSDKIFFPQFSAASPLPDDDRIKELVAQERVMIFLTTQDEVGLGKWLERGFSLTPLLSSDNQTLYEIRL